MEVTREGLTEFFSRVVPLLDERQKRLVLGAAAELLGRGGRTAVAEAAGVSRNVDHDHGVIYLRVDWDSFAEQSAEPEGFFLRSSSHGSLRGHVRTTPARQASVYGFRVGASRTSANDPGPRWRWLEPSR